MSNLCEAGEEQRVRDNLMKRFKRKRSIFPVLQRDMSRHERSKLGITPLRRMSIEEEDEAEEGFHNAEEFLRKKKARLSTM